MKLLPKNSKPVRFLSSLKLAVFSILLLAGVLATATILESFYGMRSAHLLVYGTYWFGGVLLLLGTNVFFAAYVRYPWKRSQTGFAITHLGILVILVGSFLTQQWGVDGNLPVVEGAQDNETILNDLELSVFEESTGYTEQFPMREAAVKKEGEWLKLKVGPTDALVVDQYLPRAAPEKKLIQSPIDGVGSPAIKLQLSNSRFQIEEPLLMQDPKKGAVLNLGPATVSFRKLWTKEDEKKFLSETKKEKPVAKASVGVLLLEYQGKQYRIELGEALKHSVPVSGTTLSVKVDKYLPYAVVENNELTSRSQDPVNPAVQLTLKNSSDSQSEPEKHTVFANFPEFTTLHGAHKKGNVVLGAKFKLAVNQAPQENMNFIGNKRGELRLAQSFDDQRLLYTVFAASGEMNQQGEAKVGEEVPTGWMDLKFKVLEWYRSAVEDESPRYIEYITGSGDNAIPALHLRAVNGRIPGSAPRSSGVWLFEGMAKNIQVGGKDLLVQFNKKKLQLPFHIFLQKFTVGNDPGTTKAGTYDSQVVVKDPVNGVEQKAAISMNEPLKYGGYTLYQASYQMEEGRPPVSIFAVNRDPGRFWKYLGCIIMCLGIISMFYMNPHYWDILLGKGKKA